MLRVERLEDRDVPAPLTGYLPEETGAFLDPAHLDQLKTVRTYPQDGAGGRLTVTDAATGAVDYDGFPFGADARLGGQAVVIPGGSAGADRLAFCFPNAGAGPRVGVLQADAAGRIDLVASYFVLPELYRGGFTIQAALTAPGADRYELLVLAGASGGPVLAAMNPADGRIRAQFFVGPADDRAGGYSFQPQGSYVSSPVTGVWSVAINYRAPGVAADSPRATRTGLFSLADGTDMSAELSVLV